MTAMPSAPASSREVLSAPEELRHSASEVGLLQDRPDGAARDPDTESGEVRRTGQREHDQPDEAPKQPVDA